MAAAMTLFQLLRGDVDGLFDGSTNGIGLKSTNASALPQNAGIALKKGAIEVSRHEHLDDLQSFTIDTTVTATRIGPGKQTIIEGQSPAVSLSIDPKGKLVGAVHTSAGWISVDSGANRLRAGVSQRVTFTRDESGRACARDRRQESRQRHCAGRDSEGRREWPPDRKSAERAKSLLLECCLISASAKASSRRVLHPEGEEAKRLVTVAKKAGALGQISVHLLPDESHARLQQIKDIMNAAGCRHSAISIGSPIKQQTTLTPGKVLVAPRKGGGGAASGGPISPRRFGQETSERDNSSSPPT